MATVGVGGEICERTRPAETERMRDRKETRALKGYKDMKPV